MNRLLSHSQKQSCLFHCYTNDKDLERYIEYSRVRHGKILKTHTDVYPYFIVFRKDDIADLHDSACIPFREPEKYDLCENFANIYKKCVIGLKKG